MPICRPLFTCPLPPCNLSNPLLAKSSRLWVLLMQRRICFRQPPSQSRHNLCISAAASFAPVSLLFMATPTTGHELAASPAATAAAIYVPRLALTAALSMSHDGNPEQPKKLGNTFFLLSPCHLSQPERHVFTVQVHRHNLWHSAVNYVTSAGWRRKGELGRSMWSDFQIDLCHYSITLF